MSKFEGIRILDAFKGGVQIAPGKKEIFKSQDSLTNGQSSLLVRIPMTHSGILTRNLGFYLPSKMQKGAKTFTDGFQKPVLKGHGGGFFSSNEPEPIGRVKAANYMDISADWTKKDVKLAALYKAHFSKDEEEALGAGVGLANHIYKKYIKKNRNGYQGLGFIDGILDIPDEEAAQKILDGRFMTVSVAVGSKDAWCTVCSQNLVKDGPCDHRRGDNVDGQLAMVMLGDMFYEHVAVVNSPADPFAAKFELYSGKDSFELPAAADALSQDALEVAADARCFIYYNMDNIQPLYTEENINLVQLNQNVGGIIKAMKGKDTEVAKKVNSTNETEVETPVEVVVEETPAEVPTEDSTQNEGQVTETDDVNTGPVTEETETDATDEPAATETEETDSDDPVVEDEDPLRPFIQKLSDKLEVPVEDLRFCAEFFYEASKTDSADADIHHEARNALGITEGLEYDENKFEEYVSNFKNFYDSLIIYEDLISEDGYKYFEELLEEDAKLTSKQRKKLSGSTFCGPNRSFPVNDCAHYTAALRLLNRAKVSSATKAKIRSCVLRKGKKMNCSGTKNKDNTDLDTTNTAWDNKSGNQQLMQINDKELKQKIKSFMDELLKRGLTTSCDSCSDLQKQNEILNSQLDSAYEEVNELTNNFKELEDSYKTQLAERAVELKVLSGTDIKNHDEEIDKYKNRETVSLEDTVKDLTESISLNDVAAKLNDGISRDPTEQVESPVLHDSSTENVPESENSKKEHEQKAKVRAIYDAYDYYLKTHGKEYADKYIKDCKKKGLIPEN